MIIKTAFGAIAAISLSIASAHAGTVSFFLDNGFSDATEEAANQRADLVASGNTVTNFDGTLDATWIAALSGVDALVIPELENGALSPALSAAVKLEIRNFVSNGGNLVMTNSFFGNTVSFLNEVFGFALVANTSGPATALDLAEAAGTDFAGGPASLGNISAVNGISSASLSFDMKDIYNDGADFTAVFTTAFGAGNISFLGYDWFSGQDGDWASVQDIAVNLGMDGTPVPLPLAMPMFLMGLGGLRLMTRKRSA